MKKNYVFVCIFFAAVALYAGGKKDKRGTIQMRQKFCPKDWHKKTEVLR